jgi:hypothetical protein
MKSLINLILVIPVICYSQNIDLRKLKGKAVKINQVIQMDKPFIYDYKINSFDAKDSLVFQSYSNNIAEKGLTEKYKQFFLLNEGNKKVNFLKLNYKFSFEEQGKLTSIIKFQEVKGGVISNPKIISVKKMKNVWIQTDSENLKLIEYIVQHLKIKSFWQFYNNENNPNYPEINKLKPLVQDSKGILNIEKLAKVLKENKSALSKYLD